MKYKKYNSFDPFEAFATVLNDVFQIDENLGQFGKKRPAINIIEGDLAYTIEVAAPGLSKEDFKISVEKDQLMIQVEKPSKERQGKAVKSEFDFSKFSRSFHLSEDIDRNKISAEYDKGILNILLEKREAAKDKGPQTIKIS